MVLKMQFFYSSYSYKTSPERFCFPRDNLGGVGVIICSIWAIFFFSSSFGPNVQSFLVSYGVVPPFSKKGGFWGVIRHPGEKLLT